MATLGAPFPWSDGPALRGVLEVIHGPTCTRSCITASSEVGGGMRCRLIDGGRGIGPKPGGCHISKMKE